MLSLRCRFRPKLPLRCGCQSTPHLSVSFGRKSHLSGSLGRVLEMLEVLEALKGPLYFC